VLSLFRALFYLNLNEDKKSKVISLIIDLRYLLEISCRTTPHYRAPGYLGTVGGDGRHVGGGQHLELSRDWLLLLLQRVCSVGVIFVVILY